MSQFDQVMQALRNLHEGIAKTIMLLEEVREHQRKDAEEYDKLFGEDPYPFGTADESGMEGEILGRAEEVEVIQPRMPGVTRRVVEYQMAGGGTGTVPLEQLDPRVVEVIQESVRQNAIWLLYQDQMGNFRVSADDSIVNAVRSGQVAPQDNEPDDSEVPTEG